MRLNQERACQVSVQCGAAERTTIPRCGLDHSWPTWSPVIGRQRPASNHNQGSLVAAGSNHGTSRDRVLDALSPPLQRAGASCVGGNGSRGGETVDSAALHKAPRRAVQRSFRTLSSSPTPERVPLARDPPDSRVASFPLSYEQRRRRRQDLVRGGVDFLFLSTTTQRWEVQARQPQRRNKPPPDRLDVEEKRAVSVPLVSSKPGATILPNHLLQPPF
ncbi:hypothetical protein VTI28DRAFT_8490 [Corynascus sepedonium]